MRGDGNLPSRGIGEARRCDRGAFKRVSRSRQSELSESPMLQEICMGPGIRQASYFDHQETSLGPQSPRKKIHAQKKKGAIISILLRICYHLVFCSELLKDNNLHPRQYSYSTPVFDIPPWRGVHDSGQNSTWNEWVGVNALD